MNPFGEFRNGYFEPFGSLCYDLIMGRPKKFCREDVLARAMPLFWEKGYAACSLKDLEGATGVNKSGLYGEFRDKDDLFAQSLDLYLAQSGVGALLAREPLGLANIERFLLGGDAGPKTSAPKVTGTNASASTKDSKDAKDAKGSGGCFAMNLLRETADLPVDVRKRLESYFDQIRVQLLKNLRVENLAVSPAMAADLIETFAAGLHVPESGDLEPRALQKRVHAFVELLRAADGDSDRARPSE